MSLLDYQTLDQLLRDYATHSQPGDVVLRDATGDHQPAELLRSLSASDLRGRIVEIGGDYGESWIVAQSASLFSGTRKRYSIHWSPDRQGWAFPNGFGRSIHYFVPRHYLDDPPLSGEGMLVSLCKRNYLETSHMFRPPDPKYSVCKTCERTLDKLVRERTGQV